MTEFKTQSIRQQHTVGEKLRTARQSRGVKLVDVAQKLKISQRYLDALERGHYNDLPSPVYIKNYLRLYVRELGLSWDEFQQQFEQEIRVYRASAAKAPVTQGVGGRRGARQHRSTQPVRQGGAHHRRPLVIPRLFKVGGFGIVILLVAVYFVWEVVQLLSPPELVVTYPAEDIIVTEPKLTVVGKTEPEVFVELNGQTVAVEPDGTFEEEVVLREGLNTLRVTARTKRSSESVEVRNVLLDPADEANQ